MNDDIKQQYLDLRNSYVQMVGTLYTGIAYNNLVKLREQYVSSGGDSKELPSIMQPKPDGSVPYHSEAIA